MVFLFIVIMLFFFIITSKIRIDIKNVDIILKEKSEIKIKDNYLINIKFVICNVLPIIKINITKQKISKIKRINKNLKRIRKNSSMIEVKKAIKDLDIEIKEIYLKAGIGLDNIMILTYIIPITCTAISAFLANKSVKNQFYNIYPIYNSR